MASPDSSIRCRFRVGMNTVCSPSARIIMVLASGSDSSHTINSVSIPASFSPLQSAFETAPGFRAVRNETGAPYPAYTQAALAIMPPICAGRVCTRIFSLIFGK